MISYRDMEVQASITSQVKACIQKDAILQRRRLVGLLLLSLSPLLVCLSLLFAQDVVSSQIDDQNFKCGCKCLTCCDWVSTGDGERVHMCYNSTSERPCSPYATCTKHDNDDCSFLYSTIDQASFCDIKYPPLWPPVLQIPEENARGMLGKNVAGPSIRDGFRKEEDEYMTSEPTPVYLLYTGENPKVATNIMNKIFPDAFSVTENAALSYLNSVVAEELEHESEIPFNSSDLSGKEREFLDTIGSLTRGVYEFGLILGTSEAKAPNVIIEPAFAPIWSSSKNSGKQRPIYILQSDCTKVSPSDYQTLSKIGDTISGMSQIPVHCVSAPIQFVESAEYMDKLLYCGSQQSDCRSGSNINLSKLGQLQQYGQDAWMKRSYISSLYDFGNTNGSYLNLTVWVNNTNQQSNLEIPDIQRWSKSINMATNAYLKEFFGEDISLSMAGLKDMPKQEQSLSLNFSSLFGPLFSMWLMHIMLPIFVYGIVVENGEHINLMCHVQGLSRSAYYCSKYIWNFFLYLFYMTLFAGFGCLVGLKMFVSNSFSVQFVFYFLWETPF